MYLIPVHSRYRVSSSPFGRFPVLPRCTGDLRRAPAPLPERQQAPRSRAGEAQEASGGSRARVHGENKITAPLAGGGQLIMAQKCTKHPVAQTSYEQGRGSPWDRRDRLFETKGQSIAL